MPLRVIPGRQIGIDIFQGAFEHVERIVEVRQRLTANQDIVIAEPVSARQVPGLVRPLAMTTPAVHLRASRARSHLKRSSTPGTPGRR
jgi:hypothetical protein